eukprot:gene9579-9741_t
MLKDKCKTMEFVHRKNDHEVHSEIHEPGHDPRAPTPGPEIKYKQELDLIAAAAAADLSSLSLRPDPPVVACRACMSLGHVWWKTAPAGTAGGAAAGGTSSAVVGSTAGGATGVTASGRPQAAFRCPIHASLLQPAAEAAVEAGKEVAEDDEVEDDSSRLQKTLEVEVPDTAASMRLSSLELSDCLSELGALGNDLSNGVRSTARLITAADSGVKQGGQLVVNAVVPALARRETQLRACVRGSYKYTLTVRAAVECGLDGKLVTAAGGYGEMFCDEGGGNILGSYHSYALCQCATHGVVDPVDAVEAALKARAVLAPQLPAVRAAVGATTTSVRRLRGVLFAAGVAVDLGRAVRARLTEAALQQLVARQQLLTADAARQQQPQKNQQGGFRGAGLSDEAATTRAA